MAIRYAWDDFRYMAGPHPVERGTLLRGPGGDIGDVQAVITRPAVIENEWTDIIFKVNVWRLGESRLWAGKDVSVVLDPDTGEPPERLEL